MTVDITDIVKGVSVHIAVSGVLEIPQEYNLSDVNVAAGVGVDIEGKLENTGEYYFFEGILKAKLPLRCDKCLAAVELPLQAELLEKFSNTGYVPGDEDIWEFTGKLIDLEPVAMSCLLLNIPLKTTCGEDCKGLCHVCGNDLNLGECGCEKSDIDPRFEGLLSLFQDKEV